MIILFTILLVVFVLLVKYIAIVLFLFPLILAIGQLGYYRGLVGGGLSALLNTIWFWLVQPTDISTDTWLASTLLLVCIGAVISYILYMQQQVDKENQHIEQIIRDVEQTRVQMNALRSALPDRAFVFDKDGRYVDVLSQYIASDLTQYLIGKKVTETPEILKPETAQKFFEVIQETIKTGETQTYLYQAFTSLEKTWRWLEGQTALIEQPINDNPLVIWLARDVTERKNDEDSLQKIQHIAQIGTWETDVENNYVTWSDEMYKIYGIKPEEFDHTVEFVITRMHPDDLQSFRDKLEKGINPYPTEYRIRRPDKSYRTVYAVGDTIYNADGKLIRRIGLLQDITERRQAEQQRIQLQIAQQRTNTLRNLITDVTHDLMTPVTVIKTSLFILKQINADERISHHVNKVETHINILQEIVQSLLTVSYLDEVQFDNLVTKPSNFMLLIRSLAQQYRSMMSNKNQTFITTFPDHPIMIRYDHDYMQKAISNLLQNAMQYTPDGGQIELIVTEQDHQLEVKIIDNGIGINAEDHQRIFDPFYRVEKHRPVNGNSGLGLRITKLIIELHGGQIEVNSVLGEGSTFCLQLPIV